MDKKCSSRLFQNCFFSLSLYTQSFSYSQVYLSLAPSLSVILTLKILAIFFLNVSVFLSFFCCLYSSFYSYSFLSHMHPLYSRSLNLSFSLSEVHILANVCAHSCSHTHTHFLTLTRTHSHKPRPEFGSCLGLKDNFDKILTCVYFYFH